MTIHMGEDGMPEVAPPETPNEDQAMTFMVTVHSFGRGDDAHVLDVVAFMWDRLHHSFGADRVQVKASDGRSIRYLPASDPESHGMGHVWFEDA